MKAKFAIQLANAPEQIIRSDQRAEHEERRPHADGIVIGQHVDQEFYAVLGADGARHGREHRG